MSCHHEETSVSYYNPSPLNFISFLQLFPASEFPLVEDQDPDPEPREWENSQYSSELGRGRDSTLREIPTALPPPVAGNSSGNELLFDTVSSLLSSPWNVTKVPQ